MMAHEPGDPAVGKIIGLQDRQLIENHEFVCDLARFSENLLTEKFIRKKYGNLTEATWTRLGKNDELVSAVEAEKIRRTRDGSSKREKSQQLIVAAPDILSGIMTNAASPKHQIDAIKTLDSFTGTPGESAPVGDRFIISIVLNADDPSTEHTETYSKSIKIDPDDVDPYASPAGVIAASTKKTDGDGGGEPI
jgi:hypothetical protein